MESRDSIQLDGAAGVDELTAVSVADNTLTCKASSGNSAEQSNGNRPRHSLVADLVSIDGARAVIRIAKPDSPRRTDRTRRRTL
ncbi:hypothetical protein HRW23_33055 [Streptomyces lunaelactis]|uniref:hypothetical protein n=1 Tax=Streptomyces lunaelactis TaxID=1535768 RepID=UPI001585CF32|nr:hypothetical protein [Streptomyces lunaelactis]NUK01611.1 hypothetical protein [Streptomyces lunaelactis]NUK18671.1 hypothetical protein [Streptomyces lunaelactis]NUK26234.1 hypothetical protein [Streptomyces lunaelactis]NUK37683.1 hypothetical protein [Streptomyces lunaelactis]NUK44477.1 hypothetical protein [Streptomyces lunaelactis]